MTVHITPLNDPDRPRLAWVAAAPDGRPLGAAYLWVPAAGGVGELKLHVHPAERRAGVGRRLLDAAAAAGAAKELRGLVTEAVDEVSAGDAFCVARGLRQALALTYTRLQLGGPLPGERPVDGYRLVSWEGTVPDELAGTFARSRRAMDDMPMGDAGYVPEPWDVARLHQIAEAVARRGEVLSTVAVLDEGGEVVGFTELVVPGDGTGDGQHYGTGVLPGHRGRGLSRWLKVRAIRQARERFPKLGGLLADTADENVAMRRVNESLGYRPTHRSLLYRLDLQPTSAG